jgi:hypothetical protein
MPTIGIDFKMKTVMVEGKRLKVQVVSLSLLFIPAFPHSLFRFYG